MKCFSGATNGLIPMRSELIYISYVKLLTNLLVDRYYTPCIGLAIDWQILKIVFQNSLRLRVIFIVGSFAAVLSILWGFVVFAGVRLTEDWVLTNLLRNTAEDIAGNTASLNEGIPLGIEKRIQSYQAGDKLPSYLDAWLHEKNRPEGYYELSDQDVHIAIVTPDDKSTPIVVVFDVSGIEADSSHDKYWVAGLLLVALLITVCTTVFAASLATKAISPVIKLSNAVKDINPENLQDYDWRSIEAASFTDDEVGQLARIIEKTLKRVGTFIERERFFTSAASHELRTPVTVVDGALELLMGLELPNNISRIVSRIDRATSNMKNTIQLLLCMSREDSNKQLSEMFSVNTLVEQAVKEHQSIVTSKSLSINFRTVAEPTLIGDPQAFSIVLNNIIRNAIEHAPGDLNSIEIVVEHKMVLVSNQIDSNLRLSGSQQEKPEPTKDDKGYGLGLSIVEKLCKNNHWLFRLEVNESAALATLSWN